MITAAIVTWLILNLVAIAICTSSKRRDLDHAMRRHPSNWPGDKAEVVCAFCGMRVLIVAADSDGVPIVHGTTLEDQLSAHDRDCAGRVAV